MRILGVAATCLLLSGCITSSAPPPATTSSAPKILAPYTLAKDEVSAVEKGVREVLKDPDSARFGRMVAGSNGADTVTVCLMVNAKNSYGGYTGEKPYMGLLFTDKKPKLFIAHTGSERPELLRHRDQATLNVCNQYGLML